MRETDKKILVLTVVFHRIIDLVETGIHKTQYLENGKPFPVEKMGVF